MKEDDRTVEDDEEVSVWNNPPRPPLLAYDPALRIGYLPVVATDDGRADEQTLAKAAAWMLSGQLPDGTPLVELRLIAPVRAAALALRSRLGRTGALKVLYVTSDGRFWDPLPMGAEEG